MSNSPYCKDTRKIALAFKISAQLREKMFAKLIAKMTPDASHVILDIGVTRDERSPESNYFERPYPYKNRIVCMGTEDGSYFETKYPGVKFNRIIPQKPFSYIQGQGI